MERELKFSKYNYVINVEDFLCLYNSRTGAFLLVDRKYNELIGDFKNQDLIEFFPEELIKYLKEGEFLVDKEIDELKLIKSQYNIMGKISNYFSITIAPTLACNFRCTYCFESWNGFPTEKMTKSIVDKIIQLIDEKLNYNGTLDITWYGGEPLLSVDVMEYFYNEVQGIIAKKNISMNSYIITNGYLLTKDISDKLVEFGIKGIQVTIDGVKKTHDKKRVLINGKGTFDTIIKNIVNCNKNIKITIRVNLDKDNIDEVDLFIDYINEIGLEVYENVNFYFAIIRESYKNNGGIRKSYFSLEEYSFKESLLNKKALEKGINILKDINPISQSCGAVSPNSMVVEPDGTIQKCYELVGDKFTKIGNIMNSDFVKDDLILKNQSEWYSWSPFEQKDCLECKVLPLCLGGCPYYSLNDVNSYLYKENLYKCSSLKFNLEDNLYLFAKESISEINGDK